MGAHLDSEASARYNGAGYVGASIKGNVVEVGAANSEGRDGGVGNASAR
jgi:hypothetical protein